MPWCRAEALKASLPSPELVVQIFYAQVVCNNLGKN